MKWPNVKLIFARELRDQLRDRRTLFTVAVMPIVLYPLMGMAMLQVAQFMREYPSAVWVVGADQLPNSPSLLTENQFNSEFVEQDSGSLIKLTINDSQDSQFNELVQKFRERQDMPSASGLVDQIIQAEMKSRAIDVAVMVLPTATGDSEDSSGADQPRPKVYVFKNSASDQSVIGARRVREILGRWQQAFVKQQLSDHGVAPSVLDGVQVIDADVADKIGKRNAVWSKLFPFIVMIWSLTGAFYPAIDLCAGEKERGTFETLLSSPAARSEIAIGKLMTVMTFSIVTALLNLISMAFTGLFVASQMGGVPGMANIGLPPIASVGWLLLALIPISGLFSAVALAAAAFARSSKEGQYYLVPLMMISMPLMMIPMMPAIKLDFGTSLIPVTGLMLLLRNLIEGQYTSCLQYVGPIGIVTFACCWFSVRWVVHQFNSESVLFRPSERFAVGTWVRSAIRERHDLPTLGNALLCAVIILVAKFFVGLAAAPPHNFFEFSQQTLIILVATIAMPAALMALILTRDPAKSLRLRGCSLPAACAAVLLAICLNPLFTWFTSLVMIVYPPPGELFHLQEVVANILGTAPNMWAIIALFALAPAIMEELAFRGFILSGLESMRNKWQAILLSSLLFGIAHGVLQQSVITSVVGIVMAIVAVQTKSLIPCILFHLTHNSLTVLLSQANAKTIEGSSVFSSILTSSNGITFQYAIIPGLLMTVAGVGLLTWMLRLDEEEQPTFDVYFQPLINRWLGKKSTGTNV